MRLRLTRRHVDGEARLEHAEPRQVAALVADGRDHAPDRVVEPGRVHARAADGLLHDERGQFHGLEGVQRAVSLPEPMAVRTAETMKTSVSGMRPPHFGFC